MGDLIMIILLGLYGFYLGVDYAVQGDESIVKQFDQWLEAKIRELFPTARAGS
jgi:hypothetical protein